MEKFILPDLNNGETYCLVKYISIKKIITLVSFK